MANVNKSGHVRSDMQVTGSFTTPDLTGCDDVFTAKQGLAPSILGTTK